MPQLHFGEEDWARVERDTMAWWAGELPRPLVYLHGIDRSETAEAYDYQISYPADMPAEAIVDCYEPLLTAGRYYADAFPALWINFGPGIGSGFLAAMCTAWSSLRRRSGSPHPATFRSRLTPWAAALRLITPGTAACVPSRQRSSSASPATCRSA
jgi:hypothetical protein